MKLLKELLEGFMGFTAAESDTASDLGFAVEEALKKARSRIKKETGGMAPRVAINSELAEVAIQVLRKGLEDKGNEYNTHGTLNVAMIMDEYYPEFRKFASWKNFAKEVAEKLNDEVAARGAKPRNEYTQAMADFAEKLEKLAK